MGGWVIGNTNIVWISKYMLLKGTLAFQRNQDDNESDKKSGLFFKTHV